MAATSFMYSSISSFAGCQECRRACSLRVSCELQHTRLEVLQRVYHQMFPEEMFPEVLSRPFFAKKELVTRLVAQIANGQVSNQPLCAKTIITTIGTHRSILNSKITHIQVFRIERPHLIRIIFLYRNTTHLQRQSKRNS